MKNLLIVTFDIIYHGKPNTQYAVGSILASLNHDEYIRNNYDVRHKSFNIYGGKQLETENILVGISEIFALNKIDFIAIGCYVWNERYVNSTISLLKKYGCKAKIILGGYQIQPNYCRNDYPLADYYILGYAEAGFKYILQSSEQDISSNIINLPIDFSCIPSPYLTNTIEIFDQQTKVLLETKRGCPYSCTFCAHKDLRANRVFKHPLERTYAELLLFKEKQVTQVNFLDPIFNIGNEYINVLRIINDISLDSFCTIQTRFESIKGKNEEEFLSLCSSMNIRLEFGIQTAIEQESALIERRNNNIFISKVMKKLNDYGINYEVSLIYGLPTQTVDSFKRSIDFVKENGCNNVLAFPLMLLKGTKLYEDRKIYKFTESNWGEYDLPVVTSSTSFDKKDWNEMDTIARSL